jgi:hypothetical protein
MTTINAEFAELAEPGEKGSLGAFCDLCGFRVEREQDNR